MRVLVRFVRFGFGSNPMAPVSTTCVMDLREPVAHFCELVSYVVVVLLVHLLVVASFRYVVIARTIIVS